MNKYLRYLLLAEAILIFVAVCAGALIFYAEDIVDDLMWPFHDLTSTDITSPAQSILSWLVIFMIIVLLLILIFRRVRDF